MSARLKPRRPPPPPVRPAPPKAGRPIAALYVATERQAGGRAYWTRTRAAAREVVRRRRASGWFLGSGPTRTEEGEWYIWLVRSARAAAGSWPAASFPVVE